MFSRYRESQPITKLVPCGKNFCPGQRHCPEYRSSHRKRLTRWLDSSRAVKLVLWTTQKEVRSKCRFGADKRSHNQGAGIAMRTMTVRGCENPAVYRPRAYACARRFGFDSALGTVTSPRRMTIYLNGQPMLAHIVDHIAALMLSVALIDTFGRKPKCHSQTLCKIACAALAQDTGTTTPS